MNPVDVLAGPAGAARSDRASRRSPGRIDRPAALTWSGDRAAIRSFDATRSPAPTASSTRQWFRSATRYAGVFRVDDTTRLMDLHAGRSADGVNWTIEPGTIKWIAGDGRVAEIQERFEHAYDPRVTWLEDRYYVTWCNGYHGPTIGVGYTHDFETFHQLDNAFLPFNRNGVLFPRKVGGAYLMLSRPSDNGHTPFGDIFLSESPDLIYWGRHRHVMAPKGVDLGGDQDRRRPNSDRDARRLAAHLPRRPDLLQRIRLLDGRRSAGPGRAVEGDRPQPRLPALAPDALRAGRRHARTSSSPARRCSTDRPAA